MRVERLNHKVGYGDLKTGDVFEFQGEVFMVIDEQYEGQQKKSVSLESGIRAVFFTDQEVRPIKAKVVEI